MDNFIRIDLNMDLRRDVSEITFIEQNTNRDSSKM
jgi:hypothetical protein